MTTSWPKPTVIHLVKNIDDEGTRLEVAPTMKHITIEGRKYVKSEGKGIQVLYPDGIVGHSYLAAVDFLKPAIERMNAEKAN